MAWYKCNRCDNIFETDSTAVCNVPECGSYSVTYFVPVVVQPVVQGFTSNTLPIEHEHQKKHQSKARSRNSRFNIPVPAMDNLLRQALIAAEDQLGDLLDFNQHIMINVVVSLGSPIGYDPKERIDSSDIMLQIDTSNGFHGYPVGPKRAGQGIRKQGNITVWLD